MEQFNPFSKDVGVARSERAKFCEANKERWSIMMRACVMVEDRSEGDLRHKVLWIEHSYTITLSMSKPKRTVSAHGVRSIKVRSVIELTVPSYRLWYSISQPLNLRDKIISGQLQQSLSIDLRILNFIVREIVVDATYQLARLYKRRNEEIRVKLWSLGESLTSTSKCSCVRHGSALPPRLCKP